MAGNIVESLKPLYFLLKFIGLLDFKIDMETKTVTPSNYYMLFTTILSAIITPIFFGLNLALEARSDKAPELFDYLRMCYFGSITLKILASNVSRLVNKTKTMNLWRELIHLDEELRNEGIKPRYKYIKYMGISPILMQIGFNLLVFVFDGTQDVPLNLVGLCYVVLHVQDFSLSATVGEYVALFAIVNDSFNELDLKFVNVACNKNLIFAYDMDEGVKKIQKFYNKINATSKTISDVLAPQMVTLISESVMTLGIYMYVAVSNLYKKGTYESLSINMVIFGIIHMSFTLSLIIVSSHICTRNAKKIKRTLRGVHISTRSAPVSKNLMLFSLQLLHEDFKISAGGLFVVDVTLAYMVAGALTTYIIIIIQFDLMYFT